MILSADWSPKFVTEQACLDVEGIGRYDKSMLGL